MTIEKAIEKLQVVEEKVWLTRSEHEALKMAINALIKIQFVNSLDEKRRKNNEQL